MNFGQLLLPKYTLFFSVILISLSLLFNDILPKSNFFSITTIISGLCFTLIMSSTVQLFCMKMFNKWKIPFIFSIIVVFLLSSVICSAIYFYANAFYIEEYGK